jgi:hypothetical protein
MVTKVSRRDFLKTGASVGGLAVLDGTVLGLATRHADAVAQQSASGGETGDSRERWS